MKLKIGKYTLRKETPKILYDKHIRKLWDPRLRNHSVWNNRFLIITNNFCDQTCYSCSTKCDTPWRSNPFRWEKHTTPLASIEKFQDLIDGYKPKHWNRLSGGETTLCGPDYVEEVCEISHQHGRAISLLTNGAKMLECDPHWFEFIHLDEHIVNSDLIKEIRRYFKKVKFKRYQVWVTKEHRDLELQRTNHITKGPLCLDHMSAITLWRDTIYPCCVLPFLDGWNETKEPSQDIEFESKIRLSLRKAGWDLDNPNLVETMKNWKNTLPPVAVNACKTQCWKDGKKLEYQPTSVCKEEKTVVP